MSSTDSTRAVAAATAVSTIAMTGNRKRHAERTLFLRRRLVDVIRQHPGVADVALECTGLGEPWSRIRATIIPDVRYASGVVRVLEAQRAGLLDARHRAALPDGTVVAQQNKDETECVYREIFQDQCYLKHGIVVKDGDCIFDIGAHIGLFSLHANQLASRLRIFAFEPLPPLYRLLQANRAACGMQNVEAFCYGLSRAAGMASFAYDPRNAMAGERFDCQLKTVSDVIVELGLCRIDLLKIGAGKSGLDVLEGIAEADWPKIRQVVAEVCDGDGRLDAVLDLLRRHGFQVVVGQDDALREPRVRMVYAMHADARQAAARSAPRTPPEDPSWRNNPELLAEDVRRHVAMRLPDSCQALDVVVAGP